MKAGAAASRPKLEKGRVTKIPGLYRKEPLGEEQHSHGAGEFRVCQQYPIIGQD